MADDRAVRRPGFDSGNADGQAAMLQWLQAKYQADPAGTEQYLRNNPNLAHQYEVKDGRIVQRRAPWIWRNPWVFPAAGLAAGGFASGAFTGGGGGAGAASSAGSSGYIGSDVAGTAAAASGGSGALGTAGTLAGGSGWGRALRALGAAAPVVTSLASGNGGNQNPGAGLADLLKDVPQLRDMLDLQLNQAKRQDPLHEATTQLAMNLLPNSAKRNY